MGGGSAKPGAADRQEVTGSDSKWRCIKSKIHPTPIIVRNSHYRGGGSGSTPDLFCLSPAPGFTLGTLYRIHGISEPWTIGTEASSGCIRMINRDMSMITLLLDRP